MKRFAVTGAGGFIGSRLVQALGPEGVVALTRSAVPYLPPDQVELDLLTDDSVLEKALHDVDSVIHLAGHNEVIARDDPDRARDETVRTTEHVLRAASSAGVGRVVYVSTVHVYGDLLQQGTTVDESTPAQPTSAYAEARLASEQLVADGPTGNVVLRLTNAVGAPADVTVDRWTLVAADLCRQAVRDAELVLHSSGQQWRDFVALADVCDAIERCADPHGDVAAGTYNLGSGVPRTVLDLAQLVVDRYAERTGDRLPLRTAPPLADAPEACTVSVAKLAAAGVRAITPLADAIDELLELCITGAPTPARTRS